jgi:SulP family sulfate permease
MDAEEASQKRMALDGFYGFVNLVILTPVAISFTSIIFAHPIFAPYLPSLCKLVLFSSAVHQMAFTSFSTLPFAVGQVQDAGLIFLSAMAFDMVETMQGEGQDEDTIVSTVVVILSVSTALLGVALIIIGRLKLASAVQYIPVPVIGGYLAYIGFFCGRAGIAMMTGLVADDSILLENMFKAEMLVMWIPGVCLGVLMYFALRNIHSPYVLPIFMVSTLMGFFSLLYFTGTTLQDARDMNFIAPLTQEEPFWDSWKLYNFSLVRWNQLPTQFFRWVGMFIVVAFSSSLDVAAIEMELNLPLDYNKELTTVGMSNVVSGCLGGFTGSYIFSQTIFTMKRNVRTRVCGWVIGCFELVLILLPFSVTSYIPKLFFGSFLTLIAVDLMFEWLVMVRSKVTDGEYAVCIMTFVTTHLVGVEGGLVLGTILSMVAFTFIYAESTKVEPSFKSSTMMRTFKEQQMLNGSQGKVVTISLQGHIFFGSAVKLLEDVKRSVTFGKDKLKYSGSFDAAGATSDETTPLKSAAVSYTPNLSAKKRNARAAMKAAKAGAEPSISPTKAASSTSASTSAAAGHDAATFKFEQPKVESDAGDKVAEIFKRIQESLDLNASKAITTEFLILDFEMVFGVDATAIRSCFSMLAQIMRTSKVTLVFASLSESLEARMRQNGVITSRDIVIPLLDDALEWCEEQILNRQPGGSRKNNGSPYSSPTKESMRAASAKKQQQHGLDVGRPLSPSFYADADRKRRNSIELTSSSHGEVANASSSDLMSFALSPNANDAARLEEVTALRNIMLDYESDPTQPFNQSPVSTDQCYAPHILLKFFERRVVEESGIIFDIRQAPNFFYFVEEGEVEMVRIHSGKSEAETTVERAHKVRAGGVFGELEFFMNTVHSVRALAVRRSVIWGISQASYKLMEVENPILCIKLQNLIIRNVAVSINHRVNDVVSY